MKIKEGTPRPTSSSNYKKAVCKNTYSKEKDQVKYLLIDGVAVMRRIIRDMLESNMWAMEAIGTEKARLTIKKSNGHEYYYTRLDGADHSKGRVDKEDNYPKQLDRKIDDLKKEGEKKEVGVIVY